MPQEYRQILKYADQPGYTPDLDCYLRNGGYEVLKTALRLTPQTFPNGKTLSGPEQLRQEVMISGLRGRGGAGFSCGLKWSFVDRKSGKPIYLICNADESEPGTFKDKQIIYKDPHQMIEGMIIASYANDVHLAFIYIRGEFAEGARILNRALQEARAKNFLGRNILGCGYDLDIHVHRGAGAYICGEESAMIESIEGKRGLPRHRPPYVAQVGLFGRPTLEQNVETLFWVRDIVEKGAQWMTAQGRHERKGFRSFSVSGRVKKPGVVLAPAGVTARELIEEFCGGMADGHKFKGYLPGGASGGILPAKMADIPLDFGTLEPHGCFVGSHAVVILSDKDDMKAVALNLMKFFEDESCGQCTPCRAGTEKAVKLMAQGPWDPALLTELSTAMRDASICGLGQAAPNPLLCVLKYFSEELTKPLGTW